MKQKEETAMKAVLINELALCHNRIMKIRAPIKKLRKRSATYLL